MKRASLLLLVLVAACARITQDNYLLIDEGMSEREVNALLGSPSESQSFNAFGYSSTLSRWAANDAVITVRFVNGKARIKTFDKPPPQ
jgi:outer membrane protein assembly factor BamE (lipoprotein component of BamABCDE complex)